MFPRPLLLLPALTAACTSAPLEPGAGLGTDAGVRPATFRALGAGTNGTVTGLAFSAGSLYAGGRFDRAGAAVAAHVARWDGATWAALGAGVDPEVATLALDAAGVPHVASFRPDLRAFRWDGSAWLDLAGGPPDADDVFALRFDTVGRLYAAGRFTAPRLPSRVARWDGAAWQDFGPSEPPPSGRAALAMAIAADGTIYASFDDNVPRQGRVVRWDGAAWQDLGGDMNGAVRALAIDSAGTLHAGGSFTRAGTAAAGGVARWDGSAWQPLGGGLTVETDQFGVLALAFAADGALYAGGDILQAEGGRTGGLARWDGSRWTTSEAAPSGRVWALAAGADGEVYAGGEFHLVRYFDGVRPDLVVDNVVAWNPPR